MGDTQYAASHTQYISKIYMFLAENTVIFSLFSEILSYFCSMQSCVMTTQHTNNHSHIHPTVMLSGSRRNPGQGLVLADGGGAGTQGVAWWKGKGKGAGGGASGGGIGGEEGAKGTTGAGLLDARKKLPIWQKRSQLVKVKCAAIVRCCQCVVVNVLL